MQTSWQYSKQILLFSAAFIVLLLTPATSMRLMAQVVGATTSGSVTDQSGAAMVGAQISIKNKATDLETTVTSNKDGYYSAVNLLPGRYDITASAQGFATQVASDVVLTVGAQQTINFSLKLGSAKEEVAVLDKAPAVELGTSNLSSEVDGSTVRELPLNGRSWTTLASYQPGVTTPHSQADVTTSDRAVRGWGQVLSISGNRPTQNNYRLNGISFNDWVNAAPGSILGTNSGVDAIAEFSVLTSNYPAEYGKASGGVVNAITRSGTNKFHGSLYEFLRNDALDARNYFDPPTKPHFVRNQFGASAGGPIQKDRTFIFGDYEGLRQTLGLSIQDLVPSAAARSGNLCAPPSCQTTTQVAVSPTVTPLLGLWPLPNGPIVCPYASCPSGAGDTGKYFFGASQVSTDNYFSGRLDHHLAEKDNLFGTWSFERANTAQPDPLDATSSGRNTQNLLLSVEENHVFTPSVVNAARFGYTREHVGAPADAKAINPIAGDTTLGILPGSTIGKIFVPGITSFLNGGLSTQATTTWAWNTFQGYDDVFVNKGIHSLKLGVAVERDQLNVNSPNIFAGGWSNFGTLSDFLTGSPFDVLAARNGSIPLRHVRQTIVGAYIQDDLHLRRTLTLNLGLRYEFATNVVDTDNPSHLATVSDRLSTVPKLGGPFINNPSLHDFAPRVGFAWDPHGDGKTAVRGAFGLYDVLPQIDEYMVMIMSDWPNTQTSNVNGPPAGSWPGGLVSLIDPNNSSPQGQRVQWMNSPGRNYTAQWTLNVQRDLGHDLTASIGYVGTRGIRNPFFSNDTDIVQPIKSPLGYLWPCEPYVNGVCEGQGKGTRPNSFFGAETTQIWRSDSYYHGLQSSLAKRMSHGLELQAAFTWSKNIDTSSGTHIGDPYLNSISSSLFWFDERARRGLSDTNVGRNFVLSYEWELPKWKTSSSVLAAATQGWQLGGILTLQSGLPMTALLGGDPLGLNSSDPFDYPNRLSGPGCSGNPINSRNVNDFIKLQCFAFPQPVVYNGLHYIPAGNEGRNSIIGPGIETFDFSLYKNNRVPRISETFNVQFRFEVFNILNRSNFAAPTDNEVLFDQSGNPVPGAGTIDLTTTTSRQMQFGLKVIW